MEHFKFSFQKKHPELHFTDFINNPAVLAAGGAVGRLLHVQMENPQPQQELLVLEAPREEDDQRKDGNQTERSQFLEFRCCLFERLMDYFALVSVIISPYFILAVKFVFFSASVVECNQSKNNRMTDV